MYLRIELLYSGYDTVSCSLPLTVFKLLPQDVSVSAWTLFQMKLKCFTRDLRLEGYV